MNTNTDTNTSTRKERREAARAQTMAVKKRKRYLRERREEFGRMKRGGVREVGLSLSLDVDVDALMRDFGSVRSLELQCEIREEDGRDCAFDAIERTDFRQESESVVASLEENLGGSEHVGKEQGA